MMARKLPNVGDVEILETVHEKRIGLKTVIKMEKPYQLCREVDYVNEETGEVRYKMFIRTIKPKEEKKAAPAPAAK